MSASSTTTLTHITKHFDNLTDPRCHINRHHPLTSVVVVAIMAILAGCHGPTSIARWAKCKEAFLLVNLDLPFGVPCKDVFRIVLSRLDPRIFQHCFVNWLDSLRLGAMEKYKIERPLYNVDGKTNRRSHDRANGLGALHATVNPRNNLAHCFCCQINLNNIDLLIELDYDFLSAVTLLERWLKEHEARK